MILNKLELEGLSVLKFIGRISLCLHFLLLTSCTSTVPVEQWMCKANADWWEKDYTAAWVADHGGQSEVTLSDGTRADILTDDIAYEVDYAYRWHQAVGQALHYARLTNRRPGVILIQRTVDDSRFVESLQAVNERFKLNLHIVVTK